MTWPDHISVFHKLHSLPDSQDTSFVLDVMILSELHQRVAARCVEDIVVYDYKKGRKTAIRPFMMDALRQIWKEQEENKMRNGKIIVQIEKTLKDLEKNTWDREGAVEDFGNPAK